MKISCENTSGNQEQNNAEIKFSINKETLAQFDLVIQSLNKEFNEPITREDVLRSMVKGMIRERKKDLSGRRGFGKNQAQH